MAKSSDKLLSIQDKLEKKIALKEQEITKIRQDSEEKIAAYRKKIKDEAEMQIRTVRDEIKELKNGAKDIDRMLETVLRIDDIEDLLNDTKTSKKRKKATPKKEQISTENPIDQSAENEVNVTNEVVENLTENEKNDDQDNDNNDSLLDRYFK